MATDVLLVNLGALAAIAWIVWYFWLSGKPQVAAALAEGSVQEVFVKVRGGYDPDLILLAPGRPSRLHFNRQETAACSEMVVFPDFEISRRLPTGETITIELDPLEPGRYDFACQMGMLRGKLIVTNGGEAGGREPGGTEQGREGAHHHPE